MEKPQITQMQPDGCATRRCRSQARDLLSQPLWRCLKDKSITHSSSKAAAACESRRLEAITRPQGVWAQVLPQAKQRRAARRRRICVISGFSRVRQEAIASPSSQGQKQITDPHPVFNAQICFPHTLAYIFFHFSEIRYSGFAALIIPRRTSASSAK